jgi:hypothetical protein
MESLIFGGVFLVGAVVGYTIRAHMHAIADGALDKFKHLLGVAQGAAQTAADSAPKS